MNAQLNAVEIGERLRKARLARGIKTQELMGKLLGVTKTRYGNWETGFRPIPPNYAVKFKSVTGVSLDYIFVGDLSGLPANLITALSDGGEVAPLSLPTPKKSLPSS